MNIDLLIVLLVGFTIAFLVIGVYTFLMRRQSALANRLSTYAEVGTGAPVSERAEKVSAPSTKEGAAVPVFGAYLNKLTMNLNQADMPLRPFEYILLQFGLAAVGFIIGSQVIGYLHSGVILCIAGFLAPMIIMKVRQQQRRTKFARQLANALMLLVSSLRSGYGFIKGLELVAAEMNDPMAKELKRALREIQLGSSVDQALMSLAKRVVNADMEIVVCAYLIQREVGGNLTELMETVAQTIRERFKIRGDVRTLTAQGRMSGLTVALLPFALSGGIIVINPTYFQPLLKPPLMNFGPWSVPVGVVALGGALFMQIIGGLWIYRVVNIKV